MPPEKARQLLGHDLIIGGTANTFADIMKLAQAEVNYIGLGPLRHTNTKENLSPILGFEGYKDLIQQCEKQKILQPIIGIGGITPEDIPTLQEVGVHGVAVASFINGADNKKQKVEELLKSLSNGKA